MLNRRNGNALIFAGHGNQQSCNDGDDNAAEDESLPRYARERRGIRSRGCIAATRPLLEKEKHGERNEEFCGEKQ